MHVVTDNNNNNNNFLNSTNNIIQCSNNAVGSRLTNTHKWRYCPIQLFSNDLYGYIIAYAFLNYDVAGTIKYIKAVANSRYALSQASSVNAIARLFTNAAKQMIREDVLFDRTIHNPKHCWYCVGCIYCAFSRMKCSATTLLHELLPIASLHAQDKIEISLRNITVPRTLYL